MIIKYGSTEYNFSDWQGYRESLSGVNGKDIFPDFVRIAFYFGSFETIIMLKCISSSIMYVTSPETCVWKLKSDPDFNFIVPIYNNMYGNIIHYKDLSLAKSRVDNLLLKINDLKIYL
jgi:hypothetical protein